MLDQINTILAILLFCLLCYQAYILLVHRGVPNISTAPAIRNKMIALLKEERKKKKKKKFIIADLGSGNGELSAHIAKNMPDAHIIGYEIAAPSCARANAMKAVRKLENLKFKNRDYLKDDLSKIDAVVLYQSLFDMKKISKKLHKDLKKGTLVLANRFPLSPPWKPFDTIEIKSIYMHQKNLYLYRKA